MFRKHSINRSLPSISTILSLPEIFVELDEQNQELFSGGSPLTSGGELRPKLTHMDVTETETVTSGNSSAIVASQYGIRSIPTLMI